METELLPGCLGRRKWNLPRHTLHWHRNKSAIENGVGYIYLTNNRYKHVATAIVDKEDLFRCIMKGKWRFATATRSVVSGQKKDAITLSRFILSFEDTSMFVFHKDGNPLNFRKNNLYIGTYENQSAGVIKNGYRISSW